MKNLFSEIDIKTLYDSKDRIDNLCDVADRFDVIHDLIVERLSNSGGTREEWTSAELFERAGACVRGIAHQLADNEESHKSSIEGRIHA